MHPRAIELLTYLDQQRVILRAAFLAVPPPLREQAPAPGRWSAAGVIEHLAIVERQLARRLHEDIAKARGEGLGPKQEAGPVLPTLNTAIERLLDRNTRFEASAAVCPTGQSADAAWAALEEAGNRVRDALKAGDGLALGSRFLPHRVFGQMPLYYYFAFVGAHEARHAIQIREIATEMSVVE